MVKIVLKTGKELELTLEEMQELFGSSVPMVVPYTYPVPMPRYEGPWWGITPPYGWPWVGSTSGSPAINYCTTGTTNAS